MDEDQERRPPAAAPPPAAGGRGAEPERGGEEPAEALVGGATESSAARLAAEVERLATEPAPLAGPGHEAYPAVGEPELLPVDAPTPAAQSAEPPPLERQDEPAAARDRRGAAETESDGNGGEAFVPSYADYSAEELLEQAQGNAGALLAATVAFLGEQGVDLDTWVQTLGRRFARAWGEAQPWDADEFLDAMLTNFRSLGATVVSADLRPERAEAVTTGFPHPEHCALFGVDRALVARFNDATHEIAGERGLAWRWELEGERTRYVVVRTSR